MDVTVQPFESFKGPFYRGEAPKEVVLIITRAPEAKDRVRVFGVNATHSHVGFVVEADGSQTQAIQQRLAGELAESGGAITIVWDGSRVAQGVVGPGPSPGPGPIGIPDAVVFAGNLVAQAKLDAAGQQALQEWLQTRAG